MVYIHHSEAQTMNKRAALCPFIYRQVKLTKSPGKPLKNFENFLKKFKVLNRVPFNYPQKFLKKS